MIMIWPYCAVVLQNVQINDSKQSNWEKNMVFMHFINKMDLYN